ncbi:hypothetical protein GCM10011341_29680 [Frigidibacter albus]|nr:hypothetical protein GCM10011341_29680 [Frigidibacter albus]
MWNPYGFHMHSECLRYCRAKPGPAAPCRAGAGPPEVPVQKSLCRDILSATERAAARDQRLGRAAPELGPGPEGARPAPQDGESHDGPDRIFETPDPPALDRCTADRPAIRAA